MLYFVNRFESDRVCISIFLHFRLFQYAHDNHVHDDFNRSLYRFKQSAYIFKLRKLFQTYINGCSVCQLSKFFRKLSYDQLHFIEIFDELLVELFMNFIMRLFMTSNGFNCLFTITDRFFKYVRFIFDRKNWRVKKWANQYHRHIYNFWKLFARMIFDRDSRYISDFWITFFQKSGVKLDMTIAFHAFANDQTKRINQQSKSSYDVCLSNIMKKIGHSSYSRLSTHWIFQRMHSSMRLFLKYCMKSSRERGSSRSRFFSKTIRTPCFLLKNAQSCAKRYTTR